MATINLFGASGHAKVIMDIIESSGNQIGCLYDDKPKSDYVHRHPVYSTNEITIEGPLIISIGCNASRATIAKRYEKNNLTFYTAIHPQANVSRFAKIEEGSVVMQGAIIQSDAEIGKHCIINSGASIDHECKIGDYVHISPHATLCGNVHVGEGSWIGAGAIVIPGIKIGKWCKVGAGSVVVKDLPDNVVAYGNPCRAVHPNE